MADLPTGDPGGTWWGWTITVDLDLDGSQFTIEGSDLDRDGLTDFGYTYWFTEMTPTAGNYTGPVVVGDPNNGTAPGIEDVFDLFDDPNLEEYRGTYVGFTFAQFYMELFDSDANRWSEPTTVVAEANPRFPSADYDANASLWIAYSVETAAGREIRVDILGSDR